MRKNRDEKIVIQEEIENDDEEDFLNKVEGLKTLSSEKRKKIYKKDFDDFLWRSVGLYFIQAVLVTTFSLILKPINEIYYLIYEREYSMIFAIVILSIMGASLFLAAVYNQVKRCMRSWSVFNYILFTMCFMYCCGWVSYNYFEVFCITMSYIILGSLLLMVVVHRLQAFSRWGGTLLCGISILVNTPIIILILEQDGEILALSIGIGVLWALLFPLFISKFIIPNKVLIINSEYFVASMQLHFCWVTFYQLVLDLVQCLFKKEEKDSDLEGDQK